MVLPYREYPPPQRVRSVATCLWEREPATDIVQLVVPDGCLDLIWLADRELVIAGADTGPRAVELPAGARTSGIRLRPGAAGAVLGLPASELRDREVAATQVWAGRSAHALAEALATAAPAQRLNLLVAAVAGRGAEPDHLVQAAAQQLARRAARVSRVAADLGVSERQLHRRTLAAVGYGPKMLARVARLRRLVGSTGGSLSTRAFAAGYASQAHMNDEVRRLTGSTLVRFLEDAAILAA